MQQKYRNRRLHLNLTTLSSKSRDPKVAYRYLCIPILANYLQFILFRNLMLIRKRSNRFLCGKSYVFCIINGAFGIQYFTKKFPGNIMTFFVGTGEHFEF